ncbi:MAG: hypothetical protein WBD90_19825 [Xanthobacteraceae bacterium]|jgi:opacity protein-like surface antigen
MTFGMRQSPVCSNTVLALLRSAPLARNLSVKAEYLYVNLGHGNNVNVVAQSTAAFPGTIPSSFTAGYSTVSFNVIRAGLNWKFN